MNTKGKNLVGAVCFVTRNIIPLCRQRGLSSRSICRCLFLHWPCTTEKLTPRGIPCMPSSSRWVDQSISSGMLLLLFLVSVTLVEKRYGRRWRVFVAEERPATLVDLGGTLNAEEAASLTASDGSCGGRERDYQDLYNFVREPIEVADDMDQRSFIDANVSHPPALGHRTRFRRFGFNRARHFFRRKVGKNRLHVGDHVPATVTFRPDGHDVTLEADNNLCCVCFTETAPDGLCCSGPHAFCADCFNAHARTSFEAGGSFERVLVVDNLSSQEGELPCPFFALDGCSCAAFPTRTLRKFINDEVGELWGHAIGRIAVAKNVTETKKAALAQLEVNKNRTDVEILSHVVNDILNLGRYIVCPNCQTAGEKDDACIHIRCQLCEVDWCYVCGRHRMKGIENCCRSCDVGGIFIESSYDYHFQVPGETRGESALHEFHRRRMIFFLQQLQESVPEHLWIALMSRYPKILDDTPTPGRHITFEEIATAEIPLFGTTRAKHVAWRDDARPIIDCFLQQISNL